MASLKAFIVLIVKVILIHVVPFTIERMLFHTLLVRKEMTMISMAVGKVGGLYIDCCENKLFHKKFNIFTKNH